MVSVKNRWALVTGASRGVGRRIATALAKEGANVLLHARTLEATATLKVELEEFGVTVTSVAAELSSPDAVASLIEEVKEITGGTLDILYNNAGIMTTYRKPFEPTVDEYQLSFMVNSIAPAKLCDAFLPGMIEQNWGRVVNVTSGIANEPELMAYSCSKAALDRYVRDMLPTLENSNVLMNLMDPGWLRTDLGGDQAPNDPDSVLPGALVPVLLEKEGGSGNLYCAQEYAK